MEKQLPQPHRFQRRSLPSHFKTAYPRKQTDCQDPTKGLASIEALYAAYCVLGRSREGLLDNFHWKEEFLKNNSGFIDFLD
jgi:pre-rRNA-processing protein TSR3